MTNDALRAALEDEDSLIRRAQALLETHLIPGGPTAAFTIDELLSLLDGPEQRRIQKDAHVALEREP